MAQPQENKIEIVSGEVVNSNPLKELVRSDVFDEFVLWYALPYQQKMKLGIETQDAFAAANKISPRTLNRWKARPDFEPRVNDLRRKWAFENTMHVLESVYKSAIKGNPFSQQIWLQYFGTAKIEEEVKREPPVTVDDIRFIIRLLPEERQQKHYDWIRDLIMEAEDFGSVPDSAREEAREETVAGQPAGEGHRPNQASQEHAGDEPAARDVSRQADNVPPAIPERRADKVSKSDKKSVRKAMEWDSNPRHHKGTPRRW